MATTYDVAIDEIVAQLVETWNSDAETIAGTVDTPVLLHEWTNSDDEKGPADEPWARLTIRHNGSKRRSIGSSIGKKLFVRNGMAIIQVFAPVRGGKGAAMALELAKLIVSVYEGTSSANVRFRHADLREIGRDGPWYQINVTAYFEWDEYV